LSFAAAPPVTNAEAARLDMLFSGPLFLLLGEVGNRWAGWKKTAQNEGAPAS